MNTIALARPGNDNETGRTARWVKEDVDRGRASTCPNRWVLLPAAVATNDGCPSVERVGSVTLPALHARILLVAALLYFRTDKKNNDE